MLGRPGSVCGPLKKTFGFQKIQTKRQKETDRRAGLLLFNWGESQQKDFVVNVRG